jgi:hypothetical protein
VDQGLQEALPRHRRLQRHFDLLVLKVSLRLQFVSTSRQEILDSFKKSVSTVKKSSRFNLNVNVQTQKSLLRFINIH